MRELTKFKTECLNEHGTEEVQELSEYKRGGHEPHIRPQEFSRPGLFCKKEEVVVNDFNASTSS